MNVFKNLGHPIMASYTTTESEEELNNRSDETVEFRLFIFGLALIPICTLGLIGNLLSAIILRRKEMISSISWLLLGLLLCDSWYLISSMIIDGIPAVVDYKLEGPEVWIPENSFALETAAQTGSIYFTIAISIERFIVVSHPLRAREICTISRAKICCACVLGFSILFGLSYYGLYKECFFLLGDIFLAVFQFIIPLILLAILNLKIYFKIRKAAFARCAITQLARAEMSVTKMLLIVVLVFVISYIPLLMEFIVYHHVGLKRVLVEKNDEIADGGLFSWETVPIFARLSISINCSVNFIIYCVVGTKFRETFLKTCSEFAIWCGCKKRAMVANSSTKSIISSTVNIMKAQI